MRNLLTTADLQDMPAEPVSRFLAIYELTSQRYDTALQQLPEDSWYSYRQLQFRYLSALTGSAERLGIKEVAKLRLPKVENRNDEYDGIIREVDHFVVQLMHDEAALTTHTSIILTGDAKQRLRTLAAKMREQVDRLDTKDGRKVALLKRIEDFEHELDKRRLSVGAVGALVVGIAIHGKEVGETAKLLNGIVHRMIETYAHEKEKQDNDNRRLDHPDDMRPPVLIGTGQFDVAEGSSAPNSFDLDDEIPF